VSTATAGTLKFVNKNSIVSTSFIAGTLKTKLTAKSGATAAFNVGGATQFSTSDVTLILNDLTGSNTTAQGSQSGSFIGFDTSDSANAASGFTVADNLHDTTGTGGGPIGFVKLGANKLILSGSSRTYTGTTQVLAGTLQLGGNHTTAGAYSVASGATLAGSGLVSMAGSSNVTFASGSSLSPGASTGQLNFDLNAGTFDLSAVNGNNAGELKFELAAVGSSDLVFLPDANSVLNIGAASGTNTSLDWSDFTFTGLSGLTADTYTLIATGQTIVGGLSTDPSLLTGTIVGPDGNFTGTLSLADSNTDLVVTLTSAVPEPTSAMLLAAGGLLALRRRRA
jgi:autotransporter-associated beta strand protein